MGNPAALVELLWNILGTAQHLRLSSPWQAGSVGAALVPVLPEVLTSAGNEQRQGRPAAHLEVAGAYRGSQLAELRNGAFRARPLAALMQHRLLQQAEMFVRRSRETHNCRITVHGPSIPQMMQQLAPVLFGCGAQPHHITQLTDPTPGVVTSQLWLLQVWPSHSPAWQPRAGSSCPGRGGQMGSQSRHCTMLARHQEQWPGSLCERAVLREHQPVWTNADENFRALQAIRSTHRKHK